MALQLYGFKHSTSPLELMIRAHSKFQAKAIFADYINLLNSNSFTSLPTQRRIPNGTLSSSSFQFDGIINGRNVPFRLAQYIGLILPDHTGAVAATNINTIIAGEELQFMAYIEPDLSQSGDWVIAQKGTASSSVTGIDVSYQFGIEISNGNFRLSLALSADGVNLGGRTSVFIAPRNVPGYWLRAAWVGNVVTWFISSTNAKEVNYTDVTWEQIIPNDTGNLDIGGAIHVSSALTRVGDITNGFAPISAIGRVIGFDDVDPAATPLWDMFPNRDNAGASDVWASASPGTETWTREGTAILGPIV